MHKPSRTRRTTLNKLNRTNFNIQPKEESQLQLDIQPFPQLQSPDSDTIFVSIASYRDSECPKTIADLFTKARHPWRIFVGVCQQNDDITDIDCMKNPVCQKFESNIRVLRLSHFDAQGPMYARHLIETQLYKDEMFYLQIDSHMLFVQHWDDICIQQLALCESEKPILTTYPHDFDRITRKSLILPNGQKKPLDSVPPTFLRFREVHSRLKFTEQEKNIFSSFPDKPYPSLFWAAGFSFSLGTLVREVPYDPCSYLFVGEEQGIAMRYFTHGWDFFAPSVNIVYHLKFRTYRPTYWEQVYKKKCLVDDDTRIQRKKMEEAAVKRTRRLIHGKLEDKTYGLGNVRSIADWESFTGVDLKTLKASDRSYKGLSPHATSEEILYKNQNIQLLKPTQISKQAQMRTQASGGASSFSKMGIGTGTGQSIKNQSWAKGPSLQSYVPKVPVFGNRV